MPTEEIPVLSLSEIQTSPATPETEQTIPEIITQIREQVTMSPKDSKPKNEDKPAGSQDAKRESKNKTPPKFFEGPPNKEEWQSFIGDSVLKWFCRGYIWIVTRSIDENDMSSEDKRDLQMTDEDLEDIARPFASILSRSKWNKSGGRAIIDSADAIDASVAFVLWMGRVRKITGRYKSQTRLAEVHDISGRQDVSAEHGTYEPGFSPGFGG